MDQIIATLSAAITPTTLIVLGAGFGAMLTVFGIAGALGGKDPVLARMEAQRRSRNHRTDRGILKQASTDPKGLMQALIPTDRKERSDVERRLAIAGFSGRNAVRNYYLIRLFAGFLVPGLLIALISLWRMNILHLPPALDAWVAGLGEMRLIQILCLLVAIGFFGPALWLRDKAEARRREIEESFPNALDLIQISVEAGLGFDAAMVRVGNELHATAPALSQELLYAEREIQAGRARDRALLDMAARTGVEEVNSFANVVLQSIQFGTSVSETLATYATEMRRTRELRAQEKANRLPVQMSAVMASLMLPALILLTLMPVVIRYIRYFNLS
ncbi:MAG: type II secretion system F family protein [Rhodobacteraceae bacterium]|nr:type II secretion system F family protein [Paracoccaceae bacterium]